MTATAARPPRTGRGVAAPRRLAGGLRARPTLAAALVLALLAVAFVSPALVPGRTLSNSDSFWFKAPWAAGRPASLERPANPEFDDAPAVLQPFVRFTRAHLPDVPLWNPHIMTGRPFLADAQSGIFSPFNVPAYVLNFWTALAWIAALKLWVAGFGAYLLGRALGMRFAGALTAGVVYGFNLWLITWLSYPHASVWALIPWLLVAADRVARRPDARGGAALAALVGVQFLCGHPESSFHALLATGVFFVLRLGGRVRRGEAWRAPAVVFAAGLAGGAALAAVTLVPFAELLLRSADLRQRAGSAAEAHLPLKYALGVFLPGQWGKPTQTTIEPFLLARGFYGGALPLMLAAAALVIRPRRERIAAAVAGAACMTVVLGVPPVFDLLVALPVFSSGHNTRLAMLYLLCLALLAGWGLDDLLDRSGSLRRRRLALAVATGLLLVPIAYTALRGRTSLTALDDSLRVAWGFGHPPGPRDPEVGEIVRGAAVLVWAGVAGAAVVVVLAAVRAAGARPAFLGTAAVTVIALDLARSGVGYNPAIDRDIAVQPATPAIRMLARAGPERFAATGDIPQNAIPMNFGLFEARGYDLPVEERFDRLWRTRVSPEFRSQVGYLQNIPLSLPRVTPQRLGTLSVLGVSHVMQPVTDPPLRVRGLRLAHAGPDARVYANERAQPRAAIVGAQRVVVDGAAALRAVGAPDFDLRRVAVTERAVPGVPLVGAAGPGGAAPAGAARIRRVEPDRLVVEARAGRPGLLVVSDAWFPGWKATVDGRPATVERVDYVFRGVRVGAGRHVVDFAYEPLSYRIGWIVSLAALGALAIALVAGRARLRREAGSGGG